MYQGKWLNVIDSAEVYPNGKTQLLPLNSLKMFIYFSNGKKNHSHKSFAIINEISSGRLSGRVGRCLIVSHELVKMQRENKQWGQSISEILS